MLIYIFFYQTNSNKYGNRLNGIENVHINESKIDDVKQEVLKNDNCISISYRLDGKLIKFFMKFVFVYKIMCIFAAVNKYC